MHAILLTVKADERAHKFLKLVYATDSHWNDDISSSYNKSPVYTRSVGSVALHRLVGGKYAFAVVILSIQPRFIETILPLFPLSIHVDGYIGSCDAWISVGIWSDGFERSFDRRKERRGRYSLNTEEVWV
jgi:hypothetical protein